MGDLFDPISRDDRQALSLQSWIDAKGKGTIVACTGFGKTRVATNLIQKLLKARPNHRILIVVPTDLLKEQWIGILTNLNVIFNCEVQVINSVVKHDWTCDVLIIDKFLSM